MSPEFLVKKLYEEENKKLDLEFIDLNDNNYHDINDFPNIGQALLPLNQQFNNEIKITSFSFGADYEFSPRKHIQAEMLVWKDNGEHNLNSSIYGGFIDNKNKLSVSYVKFAQPFSRDRYNFKGSVFLILFANSLSASSQLDGSNLPFRLTKG